MRPKPSTTTDAVTDAVTGACGMRGISENVVPFVLKTSPTADQARTWGVRMCEWGPLGPQSITTRVLCTLLRGTIAEPSSDVDRNIEYLLIKHADYLSEHRSGGHVQSYINALQSCVSLRNFIPNNARVVFIDGGMRQTTTQMSIEKFTRKDAETACTILNMMVDMPTQRSVGSVISNVIDLAAAIDGGADGLPCGLVEATYGDEIKGLLIP